MASKIGLVRTWYKKNMFVIKTNEWGIYKQTNKHDKKYTSDKQ